jgi:Cu/Ag efflux pump CusA
LPAGVQIQQYADQPRVVAESVWEFERSFLEALAIVLAVSFLFLGWRTGIVVAASVPPVLALVAAIMRIPDADRHAGHGRRLHAGGILPSRSPASTRAVSSGWSERR